MADIIKITKGQEIDFAEVPLLLGEPGYALDEKRIYIGGLSGNEPQPNAADLSEKANQSALDTTNANVSALQISTNTELILSNGTKIWAIAEKNNKTVTVYIAVQLALTSSMAICTLPTGFRPIFPIQGIASENGSGGYATGLLIGNGGEISLLANGQSVNRTYIIKETYVIA